MDDICGQFLKSIHRAVELDVPVGKNTGSSPRGHEFNSQQTHGASQPSTTNSEIKRPLLVDIPEDKTPTYIKYINKFSIKLFINQVVMVLAFNPST